jgi:hypothetical protein
VAGNLKTKNTILNISLFLLGLFLLLIAYNIYLSLNKSQDEDLEDQSSTGRIVQVRVLNGTQIEGLAQKLSDYLRTKNFDVVVQGNYSTRNVERTFIIIHTDDKKVLRRLKRILRINPDQVVIENRDFELTDITIVIGEDYQKLTSEIKW